MRSTQNGPGSSGFTLVELLIVLAIFGVLMGMIFSSLTEGQNASAIARDEAEMQQNLQDVFTFDDIRNAHDRISTGQLLRPELPSKPGLSKESRCAGSGRGHQQRLEVSG